jgi:hypothetical protein
VQSVLEGKFHKICTAAKWQMNGEKRFVSNVVSFPLN